MAGEALRVIMDMGKFQGVTAYTTPTGSLITTNFLSADGGCSGISTPCQAAPICVWMHHTLLDLQAHRLLPCASWPLYTWTLQPHAHGHHRQKPAALRCSLSQDVQLEGRAP
jgi:hypothetical protein